LESAPVAGPASAGEVRDLLAVLAPVVPIPAEAHACVADRLAKEPELVAALRATGTGEAAPDGVMDAGAACMQEIHALPALLDGLEADAEGGLTDEERACIEDGYRELDPEVLDAAVADALGASGGVDAAKELGSMLRACGAKVGG
jgi:hypothetical protein